MATINIFQRNKPNGKGECPIVLRFNKDRKSTTISLKLRCLPKDWDSAKVKFKRTFRNHQANNQILRNREEKALSIIDDLSAQKLDYDINDFKKAFDESLYGKKDEVKYVFEFFNQVVEELSISKKFKSAEILRDTKNSMLKFFNPKTTFKEITPASLEKYEVFLRGTGLKDSSIGVRMRDIRCQFNKAIRRGHISREYYPFTTYKISKLKITPNKRALTKNEFLRLKELQVLEDSKLFLSYNLLIFSFYMRGMNYADIIKLKWDNVSENHITYIRSKTKKKFVIEILPPVSKILDHYNEYRITDYIFPILLSNELTEKQVFNRRKKTLKKYNKDLKELGKMVGIDTNTTSYVIRHSYATLLKFSGVSTTIISASMGHSSESVTENYLKEFENTSLDNANKTLLEL